MATIEITDAQMFRLACASQRLHDATGDGTRPGADAAARDVIALVNVLILPEELAAG